MSESKTTLGGTLSYSVKNIVTICLIILGNIVMEKKSSDVTSHQFESGHGWPQASSRS